MNRQMVERGQVEAMITGRKRRPDKEAGFTLIEVVVSLLVMAVVAALLAPIWVAGVRGSVSSGDRLAAAGALREEVEGWIEEVEANYTGDTFDQLEADLSALYGGGGPIELEATQWVEWVHAGSGEYREEPAGGLSDYLRVEWRHEAGPKLSVIFAREGEE